MTAIVSTSPNGSVRDMTVIMDDGEKYRREMKNGLIAWSHWNGSGWDYMETGWRSLEALFQAH